MKLSKVLGVTFAMLALLSAVSVEAARSKSQNVFVPYAGTVAGKQLASGDYKVKCETNGADAKLTFLLNRKVVATVEGQVVNRSEQYSDNQVIYSTKSDGTRAITEIRFASPNQVIVFND